MWLCVYLSLDRDECLISHYCMHRCVNTVGSYYCECDTGYKLSSNNHSCVGELLFFSSSGFCSCAQLHSLKIAPLTACHWIISLCACVSINQHSCVVHLCTRTYISFFWGVIHWSSLIWLAVVVRPSESSGEFSWEWLWSCVVSMGSKWLVYSQRLPSSVSKYCIGLCSSRGRKLKCAITWLLFYVSEQVGTIVPPCQSHCSGNLFPSCTNWTLSSLLTAPE